MNGIEKDLAGKADVVRLNIADRIGREAAARFRVPSVPTLIVLDNGGEVVYRHTGMPDRREVVAHIAAR